MAQKVACHHLRRVGGRTPLVSTLFEKRQLRVIGITTCREKPASRIGNALLATRNPHQHRAGARRRRKGNVRAEPHRSTGTTNA